MNQKEKDNRSNMCNPNHTSYWKSRGYSRRPNNWELKIEAEDKNAALIDINQNLKSMVNKKDVGCQYDPPKEDLERANEKHSEEKLITEEENVENSIKNDVHNEEK